MRLREYAAAIVGGAFMGLLIWLSWLAVPEPRTARDVIADLPGVGYGWIDTLERVAGAGPLDTLNAREIKADGSGGLLGMYEWEHGGLISVRGDMLGFTRYASYWDYPRCESQQHPVEITGHPAGDLAHEFGHRLQYVLKFGDDTVGLAVPRWARDEDEHFADRFARAVLALRGWADADKKDAVLNHRVRYLLLRSYWPKENR